MKFASETFRWLNRFRMPILAFAVAGAFAALTDELCRAGCAGRCINLSGGTWGAFLKSANGRIDFQSGCVYRAWTNDTSPYMGPYNSCTNGTVNTLYLRRVVTIDHPCAAVAPAGDLLYTDTAPNGTIIDYGTWPCCHPSGTCYSQP